MKHYLRFMLVLLLSTVWCVGGYSQEKTLSVDFESSLSTYTDWTFSHITKANAITAKTGSYYGNTSGRETASIQTKNIIESPGKLKFYISKETKNSTLSQWIIQVSSDAKKWTDIKALSAVSSITKGEWTEVSQDLSSKKNVYVRIYYKGSTAKRCIDDITLTYTSSTSKKPTTTTFDKQNVTLTTLDYASFIGQTATLKAGETTLTNELTYSKEDAAGVIATLNNNDGTLVLSGNEGTATVTATFDGNDEYAPSTASYTITVVDPNKLEVTFDFTDPTNFNYQKPGSGKGIDLEKGATITSGIVTLKNENNAQTSTRFFNSQGSISLRAYDGAKLSLSVPAGYYITKVVYVDDKKCENFTCDSGDLKKETQTWTGNANSIIMTFSGGQGQFSSMTISYTKSSEPEATSGTLEFKAVADGIYYATFSSSKNVVFPIANVDVYSYNVSNGKGTQNKLAEDLYEVKDATAGEEGYKGYIDGYYVPANTGVLILSLNTTTPYYFPKTPQTVTLPVNQLKPAPAKGGTFTAEDGYKYYKLAYDNYTDKTGLGFYWGAENGGLFKVKAGTAYLAVPTSESNAKGFAFDGETTGIENVNVAANQSKTIYNFNGQRVSNMSQAGLYIVNGKKVVIRK